MSTAELINTGILMGVIHVITGPDHLSALATLSGTNIKRAGAAGGGAIRLNFLLGVRWGLGHSVGLLFVGGILIAAEEGSDSEWFGMNPIISMILEGLVGLFMLALGTYGIVKANRNKMERALTRSVSNVSLNSIEGDKGLNCRDYEMDDFAGGVFGIGQRSDDILVSRMEDILRDRASNNSICDDSFLSIDSSIRVEEEGATRSSSFSTVTSQNQPRIVESEGANRTNSFVTVTLNNQWRTSRESSSLQREKQQLTSSDAMPVVTVLMRQPPSPSPQQNQRQKPGNEPRSNLMSATALVKHTHDSPIFADNEGLSCHGKVCLPFLRCNPGHLAIATGIVHGVAGPGGILGVIPAVQMQNAWNASVYLATFCLTSTIVMGGFAAFYGSLSQCLAGGIDRPVGDRVYVVEMGSALLSICVGLLWLTLLSLGKLDEVFP
jgi:hypothetical protein